ncbi:GNAT family N-acetyltransferase [Rhodovulum sp. YEN HP10]
MEPGARGHGIGKALLIAIEDLAVRSDLRRVGLDVIDTTLRARAL